VPEFVTELNQSRLSGLSPLMLIAKSALFRLGRLYDQQTGALTFEPRRHDCCQSALVPRGPFRERLKNNQFVESLAQGARRPDEATLAEDAAIVS